MGFKSGKGTVSNELKVQGASPKITVGDGGAEDTMIVFDGNAADFRIGLADGTDSLEIGAGDAHGTTAGLVINSSGQVTTIGDDTPSNNQVLTWTTSGTARAVWAAASGGEADSIAADNINAGDAAVSVATSSGNITVDSNAGTVTVDGHTGVTVTSTSSGEVDITSAANVDINATTTLTIDSGGAGSIDFAADASNITLTTDGAAEDFTISLAGATDSSLILSSTGTAADALQISTSAGGMDISVAGAAAGEDLDISCNQEIRVTSTSDAAEAIYLRANAGTSETIKIHADQGTAAASIGLTSDAGGITLSAGNTSHGVIVGDVSGAPVTIGHTTSETTVSDNLNVTGRLLVDDTTEATSTTDGSLQTDGGLSVAKDIVGGDDLILKSNAAAIQFGASSDILLTHHADAGSGNTQTITGLELSNSATSDNEYPSFILKSNEAVVAAGEFLGQILFRSTDTNVGTGDASWQAGISCKAQAAHTGTGANKTELRFKTSDDGIFEDRMLLDGDGHLELMKDDAELRFGAGKDVVFAHDNGTGMDVTSAGNFDLESTNGSITIGASLTDGQTLKLGKNGAVETIIAPHGTAGSEIYSVTNTAGTTDGTYGQGAMLFEATAGGIALKWADGKDLWAEGGRFVVTANEDATDAIKLHADGGTSETIVIKADQGNGAASIGLVSDVGGITLDAGLDITLSADGGNVTMDDGTSTIFDFDVDGTTMTIHDDQDTGDKFSIAVAQHGATTITTVDDDAAAADLTFTIDGDTVFQAEGTEVARAVGTATSSTTNCANAFTFKTPQISFTSNGTLYPSDSGAIVLLSAQDVTVTLPDSATAANLGTRYTFIVNNGDPGTKKIQCADATNEQILGRAVCYDLDTDSGDPVASTHVFTSAPGGNNDYVNFNGTTTGGIFSKMEIYAAGSDQWFVISSELFTTGTTATPFGNS